MSIDSSVFDDLIAFASAVRKAVILDSSVMTNKIVPIIKKDFIRLFETEGSSINEPFPRTKTSGKPVEKYRQYKLPGSLSGWQKGIWTGATAYSMINFARTSHANTTLGVEKGKLVVNVEVPGNGNQVYANVSIGISNNCKEEIKREVFNIISKRIKKEI